MIKDNRHKSTFTVKPKKEFLKKSFDNHSMIEEEIKEDETLSLTNMRSPLISPRKDNQLRKSMIREGG